MPANRAAPSKKSARKTPATGGGARRGAARPSTRAGDRRAAPATAARDSQAPARNGARDLGVVESPAKARTISQILGSGYLVRASLGHVRDLPPRVPAEALVARDFRPQYMVLPEKRKVVQELRELGQEAGTIYLATDPDREGEAISWHLVQAAGWDGRPLRRVVFHEITPGAVREAFQQPREIDQRLVEAQQARRVLDRLVGYELSPLLWRKVQTGLSAGRVQSVAVRLVVDREREIEAFVPREYWTIEAELRRLLQSNGKDVTFVTTLHSRKGEQERLEVPNQETAERLLADLKGVTPWRVAEVRRRQVRQSPAPPFTTSTLQQEAWRKLRFSAKKTMLLAQQLYEGVPLGDQGSVGLITYMRTDSVNVAASAVAEARRFAAAHFGKEYVPPQPRTFKTRAKGAQEAHEAVRPTSIARTPEQVQPYLSRDHQRLYDLIWRRMLASQMADALSDATTVEVEARGHSGTEYLFRATGSVLRFPGFRALYLEGRDDEEEEQEGALPELHRGEPLECLRLEGKQHFTQPPPRYTEATLVKALEEKGIGRPSTYAPIISTVQERGYVEKEGGRLRPTALGRAVTDFLLQHFPEVMDYDFTARMEEGLDEIARGERRWVPMLKAFYGPFRRTLQGALQAQRVRVEERTDETCEKCGSPMVIKTGRFGRFLACSAFPRCRNTRPLLKRTGAECPECGGALVERRGKQRGRLFYGCSNYPTCSFTVVSRPLPQPCPECAGLLVVAGRGQARCTQCAYRGPAPEAEEAVASGV